MNPNLFKKSSKSKIILITICIFLGLITQQRFRDFFGLPCNNPIGSNKNATEYIELFLQYNNNKLPHMSTNAFTFANDYNDTEKYNVVTWKVVKTEAKRYTSFINEIAGMEFDHGYSIWIDATFDNGKTRRIEFVGKGAGILVCPFINRDIGFSSPPQINVFEE